MEIYKEFRTKSIYPRCKKNYIIIIKLDLFKLGKLNIGFEITKELSIDVKVYTKT